MAYNKVVYGGNVIIDLTGDTVSAAHVLSGDAFHTPDGESATGSMANRGAVSGTIATKDGTYTVAAGYHNGSGSVAISSTERAKIIAGNIKNGVSILGVTGTYTGEGANLETRTVSYTPATTSQSNTVTPGTGYDGIGSITVNVAAIPYAEEQNSAGGTTVTIG